MYNFAESIRKYGEQETRIRTITGYGLEDLIRLFLAGWTLQPPRTQPSLKDFDQEN